MVRPSPVSVIVTVLDERAAIEGLLDSLARQRCRPDEVVVVDGGSTDGTLEVLRERGRAGELPLVVLERPGANISAGRNAAMAAARGPNIACTDAGVLLEPDWLCELAAPLAGGARFVAGFFASDPVGPFETALGATTLPEEREIRPERFLPSSRSVAFRRQDALAIGGYPEWLDYCEDLVFDLRMQAHAGKPVWSPRAVARFRPRRRLASFARQYYLYARGDGKAGLWPGRHAVRYGVYGLAVPALTLIAAAGNAVGWLGLIGGILVMTARPYRRLIHQWSALSAGGRLAAIGWVPAVRIVGDLAKMAGYPAGVAWRLRHRPPEWRPQAGGSGS